MFLVIVMHHCKPDLLAQAEARIDGNGDRMASFPGFLWRHRTVSKNDPLTLGTVTAWVDEASYDAWREAKAKDPDTGPSPYVSATSERHQVVVSHGA